MGVSHGVRERYEWWLQGPPCNLATTTSREMGSRVCTCFAAILPPGEILETERQVKECILKKKKELQDLPNKIRDAKNTIPRSMNYLRMYLEAYTESGREEQEVEKAVVVDKSSSGRGGGWSLG